MFYNLVHFEVLMNEEKQQQQQQHRKRQNIGSINGNVVLHMVPVQKKKP